MPRVLFKCEPIYSARGCILVTHSLIFRQRWIAHASCCLLGTAVDPGVRSREMALLSKPFVKWIRVELWGRTAGVS